MSLAHGDVTAIVGSADQLAIGAMAYLRDHGMHVPDDVSVAGFNDITVAADLQPALATVRPPLREMGQTALAIALEPAPDGVPGVAATGEAGRAGFDGGCSSSGRLAR